MEENILEGYHITLLSYMISIAQYGLTPRMGNRSNQVHEKYSLVYFTSKLSNAIVWHDRLSLSNKEENVIILKLDLHGIKNDVRTGNSGDYFTRSTIPSDRIQIIKINDNITLKDIKESISNNIPLEYEDIASYYSKNKDKLLQLELTEFINKADNIEQELDEIINNKPTPEEGWDFVNTDPNLFNLTGFLFDVREKNINSSYLKEKINVIKNKVQQRLLSCDLDITEGSFLYLTISKLFNDCLDDSNKSYDYRKDEYMKKLICFNMLLRQNERYNRTGKKFNEDHKICDGNLEYINVINNDYINSGITVSEWEENLYNETLRLKESFQSTNKSI